MTGENRPKVELRRKSTMGQAVEKPKDVRGTLGKLLRYFIQCKGLFLLLMISVLLVTFATLLAPALQGQVIDAMKEVGDKMDLTLKETGKGGVAATEEALKVLERLDM